LSIEHGALNIASFEGNDVLTFPTFAAYWSDAELGVNIIIFLNLSGAMVLGLMVGYERSYHGRAAGMRTYGLVCMASAALTVISGHPGAWFGGQFVGSPDPTRIIQGIVTGIGFLGAGVIMKEGFNISGLTTAASLWAAAVIGVMVGVGFFLAAMLLAGLCAAAMVWVSKLEAWLPSRHAVAVTMRFKTDYDPHLKVLHTYMLAKGYQMSTGSMMIIFEDGMPKWHFVIIALSKRSGMPLTDLSNDLAKFDGLDSFQLSHARN
jgi:putative Mg2+ transporter-C (MgtC) family protein